MRRIDVAVASLAVHCQSTVHLCFEVLLFVFNALVSVCCDHFVVVHSLLGKCSCSCH